MGKPKTRLGLDLGTDSIGWMFYRLADNGEISSIISGGVRIFSEGRNAKNLASLNEDRRKARGMRRNLFRKVQRKNRLLQALAEFGLFPDKTENKKIVPDYIAGKKLEKLDPWRLRAKAVEKRLPPHHIGRALFHLNQRRGFKSNAKTDHEKDSKVVGQAREKLREDMKAKDTKTLGQYLYLRRQDANKPQHERTVRARPLKVTASGVGEYEPLYPFRDDIAEEFDKIWETQSAVNSSFGKNKNGECGHEIIRALIIEQRDLKPPLVGTCPYTGEQHAPKASPSFQRFRILNDLNHLEYSDERGLHQLNADEREKILGELLRKERLSFDDIREKILNNKNAKFNYEMTVRKKRKKNAPLIREGEQEPRRKSISGDATSYNFRKVLGKRWETLKDENELLAEQDEFVQILLDEPEENVRNTLAERWQLSESEIAASLKVVGRLQKGRARFPGKALRAFIPYLEERMLLGDAIDKAQADGKIGEKTKGNSGKIYGELPPYQEVARLRHLCLPRVPEDEDKPEQQRIPNPTVHVGLNQLREVVNDIIRIHGKPEQIALEIGRDLPVGAKGRRDRERENLANRDNNARIDEQLKEFGEAAITGKNRKKLKLWEELNKNCLERKCVFCGKVRITAKNLVSKNNDIEIEHILPFGDTLDDGYMNLTLACRACNQAKGKRDPYAAFADNEARWLGIQKRASKLPHAKFKRFDKGALEKHKFDKDTFLPRQLPETQYLSRAALHYLQAACKDVYVVPGRLTGLLRAKWGLNSILANFRGGTDENRNAKNREDHRHHAIDAAVVGATTRGTLKKVATAANTGMDNEQLFSDTVPFPTIGEENFLQMVNPVIGKIIVSHKPHRHKEGKLHDETAYRVLSGNDFPESKDSKGRPQTAISHHIPIDSLKESALYESEKRTRGKPPARVCDEKLRLRLIKWKNESSGFSEAIKQARKHGIRRVEVMERRRTDLLIPIHHKGKGGGNGIKHYLPGGNWAYEIFLCQNGLWEGKVITTFEANTSRKAINRAAGPQPLIMLLRRGDMVALQKPTSEDLRKIKRNSGTIITRVRKINEDEIALVEHFDSLPDKDKNVEKRDRSIKLKSAEDFRKLKARQIDISPAGLMRKKSIPTIK